MTRCLALLLACLAATPALAHPHVWVATRAELVYASDGTLTGVRHAWTFDAAYSAFAAQGLGTAGEGKATPAELAGLARENTESLAEFGYFTRLKAGGRKQDFGEATDPRMSLEDGELTLRFLLPLKTPLKAAGSVSLEVYDPTYFVAFSLAPGDDVVRLVGAPAGCRAAAIRPKGSEGKNAATADAASGAMSESFFTALTAASDFGAQFANRIVVTCP